MFQKLLYAAVALGMAPAFATSIVTGTFTDYASWSSNVSGETDITFDGVAPLGSFVTYGAGGYTTSGVNFLGLNGAGFQEQIVDQGFQSPFNNWSSGGSLLSAPYLSSNNTPYIQVTLPSGISAFGIDLGSLSPNATAVQILLSDGESFTVSTANRPTLTFFGLTANAPINFIDFSLINTVPSNGTQLVADNFRFGQAGFASPTPESGTVGLLGLGLMSLYGIRRRQAN